MKKALLMTASALWCLNAAQANDYYVNATTGNNAPGNGTQADPWKTVTYALGQISGTGHTVHVAAGTYDSALGETFPLGIKNGVSLIGAGESLCILDAKGSNGVIRGVGISEASTMIKNFTIRGGSNSSGGGGLFISAGSMLTVANNKITGNAVQPTPNGKKFGGGIYILNSSPTITNNEIADNIVTANQAPSDPADFGAYGGGVAVVGSSTPVIKQNIIRNNEVQNSFFAVAYGAGICVLDAATPIIDANMLAANTLHRLFATSGTTLGAGIAVLNAGGVLSNNTITDHRIKADFGSLPAISGVYISGATSSPRLLKNVVVKNTDHGIWCAIASNSKIINNTIADNTADGILLESASPDSILNNILAFNHSGYGLNESNAASDPGRVWYNLFYSNGAGLYRDEGTNEYFAAGALNSEVLEAKNNLEGDPFFVDFANGDFHLRAGSAALDAGDPNSPQDADGTRADLGALYLSQTVNRPPVVANVIPAQTLTVGGLTFTRNLDVSPPVFADPDGDPLTYTASSDAVNIATAGISISTLTVTPLAIGSATITVTADDGRGETIPTNFTVTVVAAKSLHVAMTGSDDNSGAPNAPWRNIATALLRAANGDTIKVAGGAYTESLNPPAKVILLGGYSSDFSVFGRNIFTSKTIIQALSATMLTDTKDCTIDGFLFDGNNVAQTGLDLRAATTVTHNVILRMKQGLGYGVKITGAVLFSNNTIDSCVRAIDISGSQASFAVVKNNIVTNNNFGILAGDAPNVYRYNDFFKNSIPYPFSSPGPGDIGADPQYFDAANNDFRVKSTSPTIDTGDPSDPVGLEPDPNGERIDMGAYGGTKNATIKVRAPTLASPADGTSGLSLSPTLSWNASARATSYRLQVATNVLFPGNSIVFDDSSLTTTSRQIGPLTDNTTYYWRVNAKNIFGAGDFSNVFRFTTGTTVPTLTSISPASGNRLQTLDVVFTGTDFGSGVAVNVGAGITVNSTTVSSATSLTANITITGTAATGARGFSVGNSNSQTFTVNNPAPTITSMNPIAGNVGQTLDMVFTGTNFFSDATTVNFGSGITVNSITVTSTTSLTANIIITAAAATGARNVSVTNSTPGGGTSTNQTFTVQPQTVALTGISPNTGNRLQTLNVGFTGTNFSSGMSVNVGADIIVNSSSVTNTTSLTANLMITAAATTGPRNFSIGTSNSLTFTVNNPAPTLTGINPTTGNIGQALDVVFAGTNFFSDATMVNFGSGITVNSIKVTSTTSLTANITITAGAATGARAVSVTNSTPGGGTSTTQVFTVPDNLPPIVTHSPILLQPNDQAISITASVTDDGSIIGVQLQYRRGGEANFTPVDMTLVSGNNYQANIPATVVTSRGLEYFITATDVDLVQSRQPLTGVFSVQIQVTSEIKPTAQPNGSAAAAYRLISVPLQLDSPSAAAVLEDDFGVYDNTKWRLFGLAPGASQNLNNKQPFVEFPNAGANTFVPGQSLLLIVKDGGKFVTMNNAKSVKTDQEYSITLQPGHNFVATPFNFTIRREGKMRLQSGGQVVLRTYAGNWVAAIEMAPWEGYYIANNSTSNEVLLVNPDLGAGLSGPMAMVSSNAKWRIQIVARCGEASDSENFAGIGFTSEDAWDEADLVEPPAIGDFVSLYFEHAEWQKLFQRYSDDMRSPATLNQRWNFVVESNIHGELVKLQFEGLRELDQALAVYLVDEEMNYKQDLRQRTMYEYQSRGLDKPKRLSLVVGKEEYVSEETANTAGMPNDFMLEQNFPNPFNPETTIRFGLPQQSTVTLKIYDLAGREVVTVLEKVELPAGRHQRVWDGRDVSGRAVSNGIYFCQLIAPRLVRVMKMTVMK